MTLLPDLQDALSLSNLNDSGRHGCVRHLGDVAVNSGSTTPPSATAWISERF
jgi:hypothetical protein